MLNEAIKLTGVTLFIQLNMQDINSCTKAHDSPITSLWGFESPINLDMKDHKTNKKLKGENKHFTKAIQISQCNGWSDSSIP